MLAPRIANKVKTISFRIGETDYQNLKLLMERHNYKSLSKFVRDSIFRRRVGAKASPIRVMEYALGFFISPSSSTR